MKRKLLNFSKYTLPIMLIGIVLMGSGCEKESLSIEDEIIGTWIEAQPELYDGIRDTIIFTQDFLVDKHFFFNGFKYSIENDTITFYNTELSKKFMFELKSSNKIEFYNFIDRSVTSQVKNIQFEKK